MATEYAQSSHSLRTQYKDQNNNANKHYYYSKSARSPSSAHSHNSPQFTKLPSTPNTPNTPDTPNTPKSSFSPNPKFTKPKLSISVNKIGYDIVKSKVKISPNAEPTNYTIEPCDTIEPAEPGNGKISDNQYVGFGGQFMEMKNLPRLENATLDNIVLEGQIVEPLIVEQLSEMKHVGSLSNISGMKSDYIIIEKKHGSESEQDMLYNMQHDRQSDPVIMEIKSSLTTIMTEIKSIKNLEEKKMRRYLEKKRYKCTCRSAIICSILIIVGAICLYTLLLPYQFYFPYSSTQSDIFPARLDLALYILYISTLGYIVIYFTMAILLCFILYPMIKRCRNRRIDPNYLPGVSVLIPAYNEEIGILPTVNSVLESDYANIKEIIVINDGSKDKTHEIVSNFLASHDHNKIPIKYLNIPNGGKATALNKGLEIVSNQTEIVFTIDSDSIMHKSCLKNIVRNFYDETVGACAGVTVIGNDGINARIISILQQFEYLYGFFIKRGQSLLNLVWVVGGANAAYRKSVLDQVGGIPTGLMTEDIALTFNIICHGYKIAYDDECVVFTEGPSSIKGLCRQRFRWTFGKYQTWLKYKKIFFNMEHCHNVLFCWIFLPMLVLNELMTALLFPWVFPLGITQIVSVHSAVYLSYLNAAFFLMVVLAIISDPILRKYHLNVLFLAPISLIIVYLTSFVDMQSTLRTYWAFLKNKTPSWGNWTRKGINR